MTGLAGDLLILLVINLPLIAIAIYLHHDR
jgi:hypothetical protein